MRTIDDVAGLNDPEVLTTNRLLAGLPDAAFQRLAPYLEQVSLARGEVLYNAGERIRYAYFLKGISKNSIIAGG